MTTIGFKGERIHMSITERRKEQGKFWGLRPLCSNKKKMNRKEMNDGGEDKKSERLKFNTNRGPWEKREEENGGGKGMRI